MSRDVGQGSGFWELELELPDDLADDAGALLITAGAAGVEIVTSALPVAPDYPGRTAPAAGRALLIATWNEERTPEELRLDAAAALAEIGIETTPVLRTRRRTDRDWAERWKEFYRPLQFGELHVVPAWLKAPSGAKYVVSLDPGMAFGTGQHASTALCLQAIADHVTSTTESVLDVGCGSGILAIAAAKLGARRLVAIDNDPEAVRCAKENAAANRAQVEVSGTPVHQLAGAYDFVLANILAPTLIQLVEPLLERVADGGYLILAGILTSEAPDVAQAYLEAARRIGRKLGPPEQPQQENWSALIFRA